MTSRKYRAGLRWNARALALAAVVLALGDAAPISAGVTTRGTVVTTGTYRDDTTYRLSARGKDYYSHETHSGDWQVDDIGGDAVRINDAWVKYVFKIPQEFYDHRLITKIEITIRHDRTDEACPRSGDGCDGWPVKSYVYNFKAGEYREWKKLQDTPDGDIITLTQTTWNIYGDDDRTYVSRPGVDSNNPRRLWVRIDAPDGAGGAGDDDDGNADINEVYITIHLKEHDAPGLDHASPGMGSNNTVNVPVGEQVQFTVSAPDDPPGGHDVVEYHWRKSLGTDTAPEAYEDFGERTTGPDKNMTFPDPGEYTVYAKVVYKKATGEVPQDDMVISEIVSVPVRAWERPTVKETPPQDRIDAGDVSWYEGKYVGVTGQPVRLMAEGAAATSGQGEQIGKVLWDLDGNWDTVEREQPASEVVSYAWAGATQSAQIRFKVVTNFGIESHGDTETGKVLDLTIYDPPEVDPRTGPGDSYSGRVNASVDLAGALTTSYSNAYVEYQWRVNGGTPDPELKGNWGSAGDMQKEDFIQLTPAEDDRNGQVEYADLSLSDSWSVTGEFWSGGGDGADAFYVYVWANNTPTSESQDHGQYAIVFDEYTDDIQLWRSATQLKLVDQPMPIDNSEWRPFRVVFEEGRFEVYLDNQLRLEYDDGSNYESMLSNSENNTANDLFGFAARTGGLNNIHRVRNMKWTTGALVETTDDGKAEYTWSAEGTFEAGLTATVTTEEGLVLEETESAEVVVEAGRPTAMPGGPYKGGIAGGDYSPLQFEGNHPDFVEAEDVGKIEEWVWFFADATNGALELDGQDDHVIVNPMGDFPSTALTAEFWMKTEDESRKGTPISYTSPSNNNEFMVHNYGNLSCHIAGNRTADSEISANDGNWHHIALTWQSSSGAFKLYKDGVEVHGETISPGASMPGGGALVLGQEQDALGGGFDPSEAFAGLMDEVMIWNVVRTPEEILKDMDGEVVVSDQLVLYWKFEQDRQATAIDRMGNHDGSLVDMSTEAWVADGHPEVTRGVWNPPHRYPVAGKREVGLKVRAESGKWSSVATASVTAIEGKVAGYVRAADLRTPVREVRATLTSSHVKREALARAAAADSSIHTSADGLWVLTDENGYYEFEHLPLGSYRIRSNKGEGDRAHEFKQTVQATELTLNGPNQLAVDFVDLSVFPVGGRVVYSIQKNEQDVFESGVTVTAQPVGSTSAIEGLASTKSLSATGTNYSLPLFAGKYLMLAKKEGHEVRIGESTPGYDESTGLVTVEDARTDVDFVDHTTRTLTVLVQDSGENPVAHYPSHFSNAGEPIAVTVSGNNGQVSDEPVADAEDDVGELAVTLNPGTYTVRIPGAKPEEKEVDLTAGDESVTMTIPVKLEVAFSPRPKLLDVDDEFLKQFGMTADDNPEGYMFYYRPTPQTHSYTIRATANGHDVADFTVSVTDEVSMMTANPPGEQELRAYGDSATYTMTAGLPKRTDDDPPLAAPKSITFEITKEGYEDSDALTDSVTILGDVLVGTAAKIVSIPVVNYTVLHDPPGDGSYSYLDDALTLKGLVSGLQLKIRDEEIPVYPSPWSTERIVDDFDFNDLDDAESAEDSTEFQDMTYKGLLGYRDSDPAISHFTWAAIVEGLSGAGIVASGPLGYGLQFVKVGIKAAAITPAGASGGVVQYEVSPNRHLETPSGDELPDLMGPGKGDIYYGEGWTLGLQTKYRMGIENVAPMGPPKWQLTTEQVETYDILERSNQYVYTTGDIDNIIADLDRTIADAQADSAETEVDRLGAARDTWEELLDNNLAYVWNREYVANELGWDDFWKDHEDDFADPTNEDAFVDTTGETLVFSAGPVFEYSRAIATSSMVEFSSEVSVESTSEYGNEWQFNTGFEAWGTGTKISLSWGSSASIGNSTGYGASWESGQEAEQVVGFVLHDDDIDDNISTRVFTDPRWGTPIFFQDAGSYTSDPWEPGTNKNVDVALELLEQPSGPFDYHDGAHYKVRVRYTGQRSLETATVDFTIYAYPQLNLGNLTARFNGNAGLYDLYLTKQEPAVDVVLSLYPPANDQGNSFEKEYSIGIEVDEIADASQINRVLTLTPTFADLRAPRATVVAPYSGQRISPVFFPSESPFEVLVVSEDTDIAKIQLQIRSKQPDGVWEPWRNLSGMVWVAGGENVGVTVFDRLDRRPPRREFTFEWEESSIRSLGVGEYALRAISTDRATPDANVDIAPPFVVFLVDEAKPSVLTSIPDYQARDSQRLYRGELSVLFTDDMRGTDFDDRAFLVTDLLDDNKKVAGYVSYSPALRKVVFVPIVPFQPNGFYRVQVKTDEDLDGDGVMDVRGVHDLAGNPLDNAFMWTFRTTDAPFEPTWSMVFSVADGVAKDGNNIAAVEYGALDAEEEKDARAVPGLASQLRMSFRDRDRVEFDRDIRPADGRLSHHWFFTVGNAATGSTVTLMWQPSLRLIRTTRAYQVIRLVEFAEDGSVSNTISLDPTEAGVNPETGMIDPVVAYTYTNQGERSRMFRLDVQKASSVAGSFEVGTSGWKFFSVPVIPQRAEPFVNLGDDIDPFRLYQYDTGMGGYKIYPFDIGEVGLETGIGYFTRLAEDVEVDVGGASNHDDVTVALDSVGWHAIGNPFILDVEVADLRMDGVAFDAAVTAGSVEATLYRWDVVAAGPAYLAANALSGKPPELDGYESVTSGDLLEPWGGYWLRTRRAGVELTIPAPSGILAARAPIPEHLQPPMSKPALAGGGSSPLGEGEFDLVLELHSATASDVTTTLGTRSAALAGWDLLDQREPPTLGHTVAAYFDHPDWGGERGQYNTDYHTVLESGERRVWRLTAFSDSPDADMGLSWGESVTQVPGDIMLHFRQLSGASEAAAETDAGWQDMREVRSLDLSSQSSLADAVFEVRAERFEMAPPAEVELVPGEGEMVLRWRPDDGELIEGYTVCRHAGYATDWDSEAAERLDLTQTPGSPLSEFVDRGVAEEATYTYQVTVRYRSGAELSSDPLAAAGMPVIARTALLQSYPNPSNPEVWIPFELEREAEVVIEVYNTAGQLVRSLDLGTRPRGRYDGQGGAAYWDGRSDTGQPVATGVYLYRLVAGDYFETRRMVMLR